jgi:hypothetical protein
MGSGLIEIIDICFEKPRTLLLMEDEEVIQNRRKGSRWKPQKRFWLDKQERLFPGPKHPG